MIRIGLIAITLVLVGCSGQTLETDDPYIAEQDLQSGYAFLTAETQALQDDPFENPGYLWVDQGAALFTSGDAQSPACAACHTAGLKGVAARYPNLDEKSGALLNLEGRINQCRTEHQGLAPLAYESDDLLSLTAYVAEQSQGLPLDISIDARTQPYIAQGRAYFLTRRGQFNLSCQQCHTETWGKQLRGDTISQGHGNGFPAYRFEWQSLGSLQRRLRVCDTGVRAEPLPYGDPSYIAVELFLATRAQDLEIETPAVRR